MFFSIVGQPFRMTAVKMLLLNLIKGPTECGKDYRVFLFRQSFADILHVANSLNETDEFLSAENNTLIFC